VSIDSPALSAAPDPRREYSGRFEDRRARLAMLTQRERLLGLGRVAVFLAGVGVAWVAFGAGRISGWWLAIPVAVFLVLLIVHERVRRAWHRAEQAAAFYEAGLGRLDENWHGRGASGTRYLDE
jgi:hypothetical protein